MNSDESAGSPRKKAEPGEGSSSGVLTGHRVIEMSAFVAAPYTGLILSHLGADVIRVDPVPGPLDEHRWPTSPEGTSLFWSGLNAGKRSMRLDITAARGRELLVEMLSAKPGRTTLVTNLPILRRLGGSESLRDSTGDLLIVEMMGNFDGTSEVDYTVQPATGLPWVTGPPTINYPLNSPLPAWDLMLGLYGSIAVLDGVHRRSQTGRGEHLSVALSDVAFHAVAALGRVAAAQLGVNVSERAANDLLGGYGHSFACADGRHVMAIGLTDRQWRALISVADPDDRLQRVCGALQLDLATAEQRYSHRDLITEVLRPWFEARGSDAVVELLRAAGASCALYRHPMEILDDGRLDPKTNDLWTVVDDPDLGPLISPGHPVRRGGTVTSAAKITPRQAQHTTEILTTVLHQTATQIQQLLHDGVVA